MKSPHGVEVEWEDPPPKVSGNPKGAPDKWSRRLAAVREGNGKWACVLRGYHSSSIGQSKKDRPELPWDDFEVTRRRREDGMYDIYMRWIGNDEDHR